MLEKNGGFVFISHSHQDIKKVRKIRNTLEAEGYEPLCFYLKCLSDEDEIDSLIKREIDAREWFIFVDSHNARASKWVTREREYVSSLNGKQIVNIDLDKETSMEDIARKLALGLRVYITYSQPDREFANTLKDALIARDFQVFLSNENVPAGADWIKIQKNNIELAMKSGCFVAIKGKDGSYSPSVKAEIDSAIQNGVKIIEVESNPSLGALNSAIVRIESAVSDDLSKMFNKAKSHNEVWQLQMHCDNPEEAERLAEEAHDRLDDEARIKDDLLNSVKRGTMKMTPELQKMLDELYG